MPSVAVDMRRVPVRLERVIQDGVPVTFAYTDRRDTSRPLVVVVPGWTGHVQTTPEFVDPQYVPSTVGTGVDLLDFHGRMERALLATGCTIGYVTTGSSFGRWGGDGGFGCGPEGIDAAITAAIAGGHTSTDQVHLIGGSMGGLTVTAWLTGSPDRTDRCVSCTLVAPAVDVVAVAESGLDWGALGLGDPQVLIPQVWGQPDWAAWKTWAATIHHDGTYNVDYLPNPIGAPSRLAGVADRIQVFLSTGDTCVPYASTRAFLEAAGVSTFRTGSIDHWLITTDPNWDDTWPLQWAHKWRR